jgi:hypothetical protein
LDQKSISHFQRYNIDAIDHGIKLFVRLAFLKETAPKAS